MNDLRNFTNLYSLSKTLKFELIPQAETLSNIQNHGLLIKDETRAESYKKVKKIIDEYHKDFINKALEGLRLEKLHDFLIIYNKAIRDENDKKQMVQIQASLRKQIADRFSKHPNEALAERYNNLFAKELIKVDLKKFVNASEQELVSEFDNFTTYFTGFHENRKNIYTSEDISTAIGFRLIHQNLLFFIDNLKIFDKITESTISEKFSQIVKELDSKVQINNIDEVFNLEYFNQTLTQIGIEKYNALIGGYTSEDSKVKIKGLNEYINLYNQQQSDKTKKIGKLKLLYKQILSDKNSVSFLPDALKNDQEVLEGIEKSYHELLTSIVGIKKLMVDICTFDLNRIYLRNDTGLTDISQKVLGNWNDIQKILERRFEVDNPIGKKEKEDKYEEKKSKFVKNQASYSIAELNNSVKLFHQANSNNIEQYFINLGTSILNDDLNSTTNLYTEIFNNYDLVKDLLNQPYPLNKNLGQDKSSVDKLKIFLDSIKSFQHFIKPLCGKGDEADKDERFYGEFSPLFDKLDNINLLYNKVRNYVTKKPYSVEKYKLNFENSTLLNGWDENKEPDNTSIILRKEGLYYLAIINQKNKNVFKKLNDNKEGEFCYEKMIYKQIALEHGGLGGFVRKCYAKAIKLGWSCPDYCRNQEGKIIISENEIKGNREKIIECYKNFLNIYEKNGFHYKDYNFNFKNNADYENLKHFFDDVKQQGYKITFKNIPVSYIDQLVKEGKIYLFQIYNKDFSIHSKGTPNMHTIYWKMLFDSDNLNNVIYKLNGQGEIFYRKQSIKNDSIIIHKAKEKIENKNPDNLEKFSVFEYDIVKDKRFVTDKFQFHVPILMNFKSTGSDWINKNVNTFLQNNEDIHIIGIDRGERHLLYLSLINRKGEIIKQFSLNDIVNEYKGQKHKVDYHQLLDRKEGNRDDARKNWGLIETIKELKEGYLSQVIHIIAQLMVEKKAIVVLEDLNIGFMRGRQKVEKQVYQKFEKMLIDKLNYLVDKNKKGNELGSPLCALQLTNKFESFQKMGKQSGFLFYVPAWNTSKLDPETGFVNLFNAKYENIEKAKSFFSKFTSIQYNTSKEWFEFEFDYTNFTTKAEETRTKWTLIADDKDRYSYNKSINSGKGGQELFKVSERLKLLFEDNNIIYGGGENLIPQFSTQTTQDFFRTLFKLLNVTLSLRHNNGEKGNKEEDYILSPVMNKEMHFFDSRIANEKQPKDADANGAYNIARKGLLILNKIDDCEDFKALNLTITNKEWLAFAQKK